MTEITNLPGSRPETTLNLFERALDTGAIGGVLPVSRNQPQIHRIWTEGVQRLAAKANLPTYTPKAHRSAMHANPRTSTRVESSRVEAPGIAPVGAVASASGEASLSLFHKGPVDLFHNGTQTRFRSQGSLSVRRKSTARSTEAPMALNARLQAGHLRALSVGFDLLVVYLYSASDGSLLSKETQISPRPQIYRVGGGSGGISKTGC